MPYFGFDDGTEAVLTTNPPYAGTVTTLPPLLSTGLGAQLQRRIPNLLSARGGGITPPARASVVTTPVCGPIGGEMDSGVSAAQNALRRGYMGQLGELAAEREGRIVEIGRRLGFRSVDDAMCNTGIHGGGLLGPSASPFFIQVSNTGVGGKPYSSEDRPDTDEESNKSTDDEDGVTEKTDIELLEAATGTSGGIMTDTSVFAQTFNFTCHKRVLEVFHSLLEEGGGSDGMSVGAIATKCLADRLDDGPNHPSMLDAHTSAPLWPYPPEDRSSPIDIVEAHEDRVLLLGADREVEAPHVERKQSVSFTGGRGGPSSQKPKAQREVAAVLNQAMAHQRSADLPTTFNEAVANTMRVLSAPSGKGKKRQSGIGSPRSTGYNATASVFFRSPQHHLLRYCRPSPLLLHAAASLNELRDRHPHTPSVLGIASPCESALSERYLSVLDKGITDRGQMSEPQHTPPFEALGRCLFRMLEQDLFEHSDGKGRPYFQLVSSLSVPDAADGTVKEVKVYSMRDLMGQALAPMVLAERRHKAAEDAKRLGSGEDSRRVRDSLSMRLERATREYVGAFLPHSDDPTIQGSTATTSPHPSTNLTPSPTLNSPQLSSRKSASSPAKPTPAVNDQNNPFSSVKPFEASVRFGSPIISPQQGVAIKENTDQRAPPPLPSVLLNEIADGPVPIVNILAPNHTLVVVDIVRTVQRGGGTGPTIDEDLLLHRSAILMPADAIDDYILGMSHNPHFDFGGDINDFVGGGEVEWPSERGSLRATDRPSSFAPTQVPLLELNHGVIDTAAHSTELNRICRDQGVIGGIILALRTICAVPRIGGGTSDVDSTAGQEAALLAHLRQVNTPPGICEEVLALRRWIELERNDALVREASGDHRRGGRPTRRADTANITSFAMLQYLELHVDEHRFNLLYDASSNTAPPLPAQSSSSRFKSSISPPSRSPSKQQLTRTASSLTQTGLPDSSDPPPSFLSLLQDSALASQNPANSSTPAPSPVVCSGLLARCRFSPIVPTMWESSSKGQPRYLKHITAAPRAQVSNIESNTPWTITVTLKRKVPPLMSSVKSPPLNNSMDVLKEYAKQLVAAREAIELARRLGNPDPQPPTSIPVSTVTTPQQPSPTILPQYVLVLVIRTPATSAQPAQTVEVELPVLGRTSTT